jgi:hypothetical protein
MKLAGDAAENWVMVMFGQAALGDKRRTERQNMQGNPPREPVNAVAHYWKGRIAL